MKGKVDRGLLILVDVLAQSRAEREGRQLPNPRVEGAGEMRREAQGLIGGGRRGTQAGAGR